MESIMKLFTILILSAAILSFTTNARADFPCEEAWSVELDTTGTLLGPSWQEDGQTYFLVGMINFRVQIINEDGVVWESPELPGPVSALNCVDFGVGDGREIFAATVQNNPQENHRNNQIGLHRFNGEDYEQRTDYLVRDWNHEIRINKIDYFPENLPDSSETLYLGTYYEWNWPSTADRGYSGDVLEFSCIEEDLINRDEIGMVISTCLINIDENDRQSIVYAVDSYSEGPGGGVGEQCGFTVLNSDLQSIASEWLYGAYMPYGPPFPAKMISCLVIKRDQDEVEDAYITFVDSTGTQILRFPQPEFERGERVALPEHISYNYSKSHHYYQPSNDGVQDFIILCLQDGSLQVIDIDNFQMAAVYEGVFPSYRDSKLGNFDDDEDLEMAVLTQNSFTLYDLGTLSVPTSSEPLWTPVSYAISAAYPNPFNSSTRFEYEIPQAGNVALSVYDITGREIKKLADGWQDIGKYNIVLDGKTLTSGTYLISLDAGGEKAVRQVQFLK
jgi:hypothetical protein